MILSPLFITAVAIILVGFLIFNHLRLKKLEAEMATKDVPLDLWNKYSNLILTISLATIVLWFKIPEEEFAYVFGQFGEIVKHIDGIVGLVGTIISTVKFWKK